MEKNKTIDDLRFGLALSGGGSRAIAFHLGCLRVLNEYGILDRLSMISMVSGGSVIGSLYAYSSDSFEEFENKIISILEEGLQWKIAKYTLFSRYTFQIFLCFLSKMLMSTLNVLLFVILFAIKFVLGKNLKEQIEDLKYFQIPTFASRTTAFIHLLDKEFFKGKKLTEVTRKNLKVIINTCELNTQVAFYFTSGISSTYRLGELESEESVAKAVAASAAHPLFLPSLSEKMKFKGRKQIQYVVIADGSIYDNTGVNYFVQRISLNDHKSVNFIIASIASQGIPDFKEPPHNWCSRMKSTFFTTHRRTESMTFSLLHRLKKENKIKGFLFPYLGRIDKKSLNEPEEFVSRNETKDYPTNFKAMTAEDIKLISTRGEQQTRKQIEEHHSEFLKLNSND